MAWQGIGADSNHQRIARRVQAWGWAGRLTLSFLMFLAHGCGESAPLGSNSSDLAGGEIGAKVVPPADDARAVEIAEQMLETYRQAAAYADNAAYVQYFVLRGEGAQRELPFFQMSLAWDRPNRLRLRFEEAVAGAETRQAYDVACDGKKIYGMAASLPGQMSVSDAPEQLDLGNFLPDPLIRAAVTQRGLENVFPQLAMLLNDSDDKLVFPQDEDPRLLDEQTLRGRRCHRIATQSDAGKRVFWIDSETHLLLRMELPIDSERSLLDPNNDYLELGIWIDFLDASLDANMAETTFQLPAPDDVRQVKELVKPPLPGISARADDDDENRKTIESASAQDGNTTSQEQLLEQLQKFYADVDQAIDPMPQRNTQ